MSDIFISYERKDRARAEILAKALESCGWSVWLLRGISPGKKIDQVIKEQIGAAKCVVVLWSETAVKADWVHNEADEGKARGIFVPVLVDDVKIPFEFRQIQPARLIDWQEGEFTHPEFTKLLAAIEQHVDRRHVPDKEKTVGEENKPQESLSSLKTWGEKIWQSLRKWRPQGKPDPVHLGAAAPMKATQRNEFTARFVAYVPQREKQVRELLQGLSPHSTVHLRERTCRWLLGAQVKVRLTGQFLNVSPVEAEFVWEGTFSKAEFDVKVADDAPDGVVVLKFDLSVNGEPVHGPRLDLTITREEEASAHYNAATVSAPETAFASYSSADRPRVLDRVASIRVALGIDVFLDYLSLHPNDQWKHRLEREIKTRDLFLLFWSPQAAESPWVEWE